MNEIISKAKKAITLQTNPEACLPKAARLIVTINCMYRCQMCTFWQEKHIDPSLDTVKYWIKELVDFGVNEIDIGGGEPFVRNDLKEIIKEIKSRGMKCGLTTNGWLVTEENFPDIDFCEISLDGAKAETHDKIRGIKGSFERVLRAAEIARKKCPTHLNFVLQTDNYRELGEYCQLVKKLGLKTMIIPVSLKLAAQPKISDCLSEYDLPTLKRQIKLALASGVVMNNHEFLRMFLRKAEKGPYQHPCLVPQKCILIFVNGDVYPCGNFDEPVGNLAQGKSFKDIYDNYREMRSRIHKGTHPFCNKCVYPDITTPGTIRSSVLPYLKKTLLG
ncbi:MAG: radical SAM protein [Candidatus Pacebacteria bacterium]|nr:radical SAM protein [Candidatus Paceibacterota bacterium]